MNIMINISKKKMTYDLFIIKKIDKFAKNNF